MGLFLYFVESAVKNIIPGEGQRATRGTVGGLVVYQNTDGALFCCCTLRVVDIMAGLDPAVISAITNVSLEERWEVTEGPRTIGVYKLGGVTGEVKRGVVNSKPAYVLEVVGRNPLEVCELYRAIRAGEGQKFLASNYDLPEGAPSYKELEKRLNDAEARITQLEEWLGDERGKHAVTKVNADTLLTKQGLANMTIEKITRLSCWGFARGDAAKLKRELLQAFDDADSERKYALNRLDYEKPLNYIIEG